MGFFVCGFYLGFFLVGCFSDVVVLLFVFFVRVVFVVFCLFFKFCINYNMMSKECNQKVYVF